MKRVLTSGVFWIWFLVAGGLSGLFLAWETDLLNPILKGPIRPPATNEEMIFTALIVVLIGLVAGLYAWRKRFGSCPVGVKRATGIGAAFGAVALLCPACTLIPIALLGTSVGLGFLAPFLPLLRIITIVILLATTAMLWPARD
jgi:hypothetical protein